MGKKQAVLATQLTPAESQKLQGMIKEFKQGLEKDIENKYPDDYNKTIMMDDNLTKAKNEILRKIKFYKQK